MLRKDKPTLCLGAFSFALVMALGGGAQAQVEAGASEDTWIETVMVTAQKREQSVMEVPMSIRAIGDQTIQDARIDRLEDVAVLTPGLEIGNSIGRQTGIIVLRGINPGLFGDPTVLTYVDGFTLGDSRISNNAVLFDLERIEVLKGPQATLYGRNALGGVINYITRKPNHEEFEGAFQIQYGNYDAIKADGAISGPLVDDTLSFRLTAGFESRDGYWDNTTTGEENVDDEEGYNIRARLLFTPNERLSFDFTFDYQEIDDNCGDCSQRPANYSPDSRTDLGAGLVDTNNVDRTTAVDFLGYFDRTVEQAVLTTEYDFDSAVLTSITGYGNLESANSADINRSAGPLVFGPLSIEGIGVFIDQEIVSQEFHLASQGSGALQWLLGVFYFHQDRDRFVDLILTGGPVFPNFQSGSSETTNWAGFFDLTYDVTERLTLGLGARYDWEEVTLIEATTREKDEGVFLPKVTATYFLADGINLYATVSRGYKAGGFNPIGTPIEEYDPEYLWNYEVGVKGVTPDGVLTYEAAVFYMDWEDQQIQRLDGITSYVDNAAKSEVVGAEFLLGASPVEGLDLTVSVAYTDAEFKTYIDETTNPIIYGLDPDYSGNELPLAPKWSMGFSASYVTPVSLETLRDNWNLKTRFDARYTGERNFDASGALPQDNFVVANLYAALASNDGFEFGLYVDNIFDEEYSGFGTLTASLGPTMWAGAPRIWGAKLRKDF